MTGQEIINRVRRELLETSAGFWSDAELLDLINRAEQDFSNRVRGFEDTAVLSTVAGQSEYPLPANWLSATAIFYNNNVAGQDDWILLSPADVNELAITNPNFLSVQGALATDYPLRYMIYRRSIHLIKAPGSDGPNSVRMFYKSKPVPLAQASDSINIDDTLSGAIEAYVLWKAWMKEKEFQLAEEQKGLYAGFVRDGLREVKLRAGNKLHNIDNFGAMPISQITRSRRAFPNFPPF
ncbi:MAG: DUF6682 family protein [Nitrospiraceae bacterium]